MLIALMMPNIFLICVGFLFLTTWKRIRTFKVCVPQLYKAHTHTSSIQLAFLVPNLSVDNDEANQHEFVENSFTPFPFRSFRVHCHGANTSLIHHLTTATKENNNIIGCCDKPHVLRMLRVFFYFAPSPRSKLIVQFHMLAEIHKSSRNMRHLLPIRLPIFTFLCFFKIDTLFCCHLHFCWVPLFYSLPNVFHPFVCIVSWHVCLCAVSQKGKTRERKKNKRLQRVLKWNLIIQT